MKKNKVSSSGGTPVYLTYIFKILSKKAKFYAWNFRELRFVVFCEFGRKKNL